MNVDALAVGLIVHPVALIHVTVDMGELTVAMGPVILPVAFVAGAVGPSLRALSISEATDPLSCVLRASRVRVRLPLLSLRIWVIWLV